MLLSIILWCDLFLLQRMVLESGWCISSTSKLFSPNHPPLRWICWSICQRHLYRPPRHSPPSPGRKTTLQYSTTSIMSWHEHFPPDLKPSSIRQVCSSQNTHLAPFVLRHILPIPLDCHSNKTLPPHIVPSTNFGCHCRRMPNSFPPISCIFFHGGGENVVPIEEWKQNLFGWEYE